MGVIPSRPATKCDNAADQRIVNAVEALMEEMVTAVNTRDRDNFAVRFLDPQFQAKLPWPLPQVWHGATVWVNFFILFVGMNPDYKATPLDWTININDRRDKVEMWANWQFEGVHAGVVTSVSSLFTLRRANGKWRIYSYEGWDNVMGVP